MVLKILFLVILCAVGARAESPETCASTYDNNALLQSKAKVSPAKAVDLQSDLPIPGVGCPDMCVGFADDFADDSEWDKLCEESGGFCDACEKCQAAPPPPTPAPPTPAPPTPTPPAPPTPAPPTPTTEQASPQYKLLGKNSECSESKKGQRITLDDSSLTVEACHQAVVSDGRCGNFFEVGGPWCMCYSGVCTKIFTDGGEDLYQIQATTTKSGADVSNDADLDGNAATGWLIEATTTKSGWAWDVLRIKFIGKAGEISPSAYGCQIISSGYAGSNAAWGSGYAPNNAFKDSARWGGRKDSAKNIFYLGFEKCTKPLPMVTSVSLKQGRTHAATSIEVKSYSKNKWKMEGKKDSAGPTETIDVGRLD